MAFWNNSAIEPKRKFRWLMYLPVNSADPNAPAIQTYTVRGVNKPQFTVGETALQFMIHTFKYPGKVTWNNVSVTLVDPVDPDNSGILTRIIQAGGYQIPDTQDRALFSFSKASSVNALGTPRIVQMDAGTPGVGGRPGIPPSTIEEWSLVNAWVKEINWGADLSYTSEDLLELKLTISYDYATYKGNFDATSKTIQDVLI